MTDADCPNAITQAVVRFILALVLGLAILFIGSPAQALTRERSLQELRHASWGAKEGAPAGSIYAICQTQDGYLWVSDGTLSRFDGMKFEPIDLPRDPRLSSMRITRLVASGTGGLWIGFNNGAGLLKDGQLTVYTERDGFPSGSVSGFAEEDDGTVWASTTGGLARLEGAQWRPIGSEWKYPVAKTTIRSVMVDSAGTVWVTSDGKALFLPKGAKEFEELKIPLTNYVELAESPSGSVWLEDDSGLRFIRKNNDPKGRTASSSRGPLFDRDGALWTVRSFSAGVNRLPHPERFEDGRTVVETDVPEAFTEKDGLSANQGSTAFEDREGNVWTGMARGLDRFSSPNLIRAIMPPLPKGQVFAAPSAALAAADDGALWIIDSVHQLLNFQDGKVTGYAQASALNSTFRADDGSVWLAGPGHLWRISGGKFTHFDLPANTGDFPVQAIAEGKSGTMWASIQAHGLFKRSGDQWTAEPVLPSSPTTSAIVMTSDREKSVWAGYVDNQIAVLRDDGWRVYTKQDGIQIGNVTALSVHGSQIWAGGEFGLTRLERNQFRSVSPSTEHLFDGITGIVETKSGDLWLNGRAGIVHISADEISRSVADSRHPVRGEVFGTLDGLQGTSLRIRPLPTAIEGTDGRLWFSTSAGFFSIDPTKLVRNAVPPQTKIESINVDGKAFGPSAELTLSKLSQRIRIDYVGLSLTMGEKVRYRYKLEGFDSAWQDAGSRRQAFYTNLKPGRYKFHVIAANNDGVWNEQGTALDLVLPPAFVQTGWFIALCALGGFALIALLFRVRIKQVSDRMRGRVEARLAERERIARELHDTLLQSTHGLILKFQTVANGFPSDDPARRRMEQALERADEVLEEGRRRVMDLRVPSDMWGDVRKAFATACDELARHSSVSFRIFTAGAPRALNPQVREEVYAIGREALLNAVRHADASSIEVRFVYEKRALHVSVRDDGIGIDDKILVAGGRFGHWGMKGMRERAASLGGSLLVERLRDGGTCVEVTVPGRGAYQSSSLASAWLYFIQIWGRLKASPQPKADSDSHAYRG